LTFLSYSHFAGPQFCLPFGLFRSQFLQISITEAFLGIRAILVISAVLVVLADLDATFICTFFL